MANVKVKASWSVAKIQRWIWSQNWLQTGSRMPSARRIATTLGCSVRQVLRALHHLEELGYLTIQQGECVTVKIEEQSQPSSPKERENAIELTTARIRDGIATAEFRTQEMLPKVAWLCREWNVSTRTLAKACRILQDEGILIKKGKVWIVGSSSRPKKTFSSEVISRQKPVILVACQRPEEWAEFHVNLMDGLVRTLGAEADRCNVQLMPILLEKSDTPSLFASGRAEIHTLIKDLQKRYLGVLFTPLRTSLDTFHEWCLWLCKQKRPVICLQDNDPESEWKVNPFLYRVNYGDWVREKDLHATELALRILLGYGHKAIVFPSNALKDRSWISRRATQLGVKAKEFALNLDVVYSKQSVKEMISQVIQCGNYTAIVAPNDHFALQYLKALKSLGVHVPKDISLLSFDNSAELKPFPISTIDFGMSLLGYKIFHLLLGDIPIKPDSLGRFVGRCTLVDNGSLALARPRITR